LEIGGKKIDIESNNHDDKSKKSLEKTFKQRLEGFSKDGFDVIARPTLTRGKSVKAVKELKDYKIRDLLLKRVFAKAVRRRAVKEIVAAVNAMI
jgi:S-methylmethionine-dependent homocysteine/selenocysteine methylase